MNAKDITTIVAGVSASIQEPLRAELLREVENRIESFRRAVYVRDEWCCNDMTRFATEIWQAAKPRTGDTFGSVAFQLRGRIVNYCPFCGVSFTAPKAVKL